MFKPQAMKRIAGSLGYADEDMAGFESYLQNNPDKQAKMNRYRTKALHMATGGFVSPTYQNYGNPDIKDLTTKMVTQPGLPSGGAIVPAGVTVEADQFVDPATGQIGTMPGVPTTMATTSQVQAENLEGTQTASTMTPQTASADVNTALQATTAAQGTVDPRAEVLAAEATSSSVENVSAAQGQNIVMYNPVQRSISAG